MILAGLEHGFAQMRANPRMVLVFYLANFFFGLILLLPFRAMLSSYLGDSAMGAKLGGPLDMDFVFEFFSNNQGVTAMQTSLLLIVPGLYWLFGLFLSGGALSIFASQDRYTPQQFWGSAATYFGRFVRLALCSIPVLIALFCVQYLELGVQQLVWGEDAYQNITYWDGWTRIGIMALSMIFFGAIFDYARIHAVLNEEKKMRVSLWQGLKFSLKNFLATFGLALLVFLAGALVLAIYNPIANSFSAPSGLIVFMLFLLQQFYMFARMTLKLTLYASETYLYQQRAASAAPEISTPDQNLDLEGLTPAME